jgi:hypothetical protein
VKGGHRPKPFPGRFPTKIYYKLSLFNGATVVYLGKPNVEVMRRFRRLLRSNQIRRYNIVEFDRSGAFAMIDLDVRYIGAHTNRVSERFWKAYHPLDGADPTLSCFAVPFKMLKYNDERLYYVRKER